MPEETFQDFLTDGRYEWMLSVWKTMQKTFLDAGVAWDGGVRQGVQILAGRMTDAHLALIAEFDDLRSSYNSLSLRWDVDHPPPLSVGCKEWFDE